MCQLGNKSINSSKVYCKSCYFFCFIHCLLVLIVAKCIVNKPAANIKVVNTAVLIVAKCIVNWTIAMGEEKDFEY